jgi:hypothetical protein
MMMWHKWKLVEIFKTTKTTKTTIMKINALLSVHVIAALFM